MRILLMIALSGLLVMRATPALADRSRLESTPCAFKDVPANWAKAQRVDCFWLHVPESRGKPDSRKLRLFVAIARADKRVEANAPLLYIHGGPGIATVDYFFPYFPKSRNWPAFRVSRDLVYFDQRGTGRSEPAICPDLGQALEELRKQGLSPRHELEQTKILFAQCGEKLRSAGFDFGAYNSSATVEDAEDLRRALGAPQWNIYGVSYGSLVGLEYLRRHPESLTSAILDSVYPPNSPNGAEQIGATAKAYEALQRACDRDAACAARFPSILTTLSVATRRLDAKPLLSQRGPVDGADFAAALWTMLVDSGFVRWVPLAIERVAKGDDELARKLVRIFGDDGRFGGFSLGQAMTVNCFEIMTGNTADARREMLRRYPQLRQARELPEETDVQCAAWQPVRAPMSFFAPVESTVPVLLYGGEFDPATPFDDAILAARHLPNSTLVFVPGASHASFAADDCTRGIAYSFVADPTKKPSLECLAARPATVFPVDGLEELLQ